MYITKAEIYSYGKFVNQTFRFEDDFNVVQGDNGAGKSTVMSFIESILYGFPSRRGKDARNFDTNANAVYGGKLYLADTGMGDISIERKKDGSRTTCTYYDAEGKSHSVKNFDFVLQGIDRDTYRRFFGFSEEELMNFAWNDRASFEQNVAERLSTGQQTIMDEIVPTLDKGASELFAPQARKRPLNQALVTLARDREALADAERDEGQYVALQEEHDQLDQAIQGWQQEQAERSNRKSDLRVAVNQEQAVAHAEQLEKELDAYDFVGFSDEDFTHFDSLIDEANQWYAERDRRQQRADQDDVTLDESELEDGVRWILDHDIASAEMLREARDYRSNAGAASEVHDELVGKRHTQQQLLRALGVRHIEDLPEPLTDEERAEWTERRQQIEADRREYESEGRLLDKLQAEKEENRSERRDLARRQHELKERRTTLVKTWLRGFGLILLAIGVVLLFVFFFTEQNFLFGSGIAAFVLGLVFTVIGIIQNRTSTRKVEQWDKDYDEDIDDNDDEYIQIQRKKDEVSAHLEELQQAPARLAQELQQAVIDRGAAESLQAQTWFDTDYAERALALEQDINELEQAAEAALFSEAHADDWADYGETQPDIEGAALYSAFENDYSGVQDVLADLRTQQRLHQERVAAVNEAQENLNRVGQQAVDLMHKYDYQDMPTFLQAMEREREMLEKRSEREHLNEQIDARVLSYHREETSVAEQQEENEAALATLSEKLSDGINRRAALEQQLKALRQSGIVADRKQAVRNDLDEAYDLSVDWAAQTLALAVLQQAATGKNAGYAEQVLSQSTAYLSELSNGRLSHMRYDDEKEQLVLDVKTGGVSRVLPVIQLSHGEKALLFVAMRFGFLDTVLSDVSLPMIIDEAFANIDFDTRDRLYDFLNREENTRQVLYFTYDSAVSDWADASHLVAITR